MSKFRYLIPLIGIGIYFYYQRLLSGGITTKTPEELLKAYDYIVGKIGGGSGGAVVAARLSEDPNTNVLLLEAGSTDLLYSHVPGLVPLNQKTDIDWQFKLRNEQNSCKGRLNDTCFWPRGKVLGGTSVLNYMLHVRGFPGDYNFGKEWSWEKVLPYFNKLETVYDNTKVNRGRSGPIEVRNSRRTIFGKDFLKAAQQNGFEISQDLNDIPELNSFTVMETSVDEKGYRSSTAQKYLRPASKRPNLHIVKGAHVTQVKFDDKKRVIGAMYIHNGYTYFASVNKEVIISGGALHSPQILMLSGIGPKNVLKQHKIDVIADSPHVGQHLADHANLFRSFTVNDLKAVIDTQKEMSVTGILKTGYELLRYGTGQLSWSSCELHAFANTKIKSGNGKKLEAQPDLQLYLLPSDVMLDGYFNFLFDFDNQTLNSMIGGRKCEKCGVVTLLAVLLQPESRGSVTLDSADPLQLPKVHSNYFQHPSDVQKLREGEKMQGSKIGGAEGYASNVALSFIILVFTKLVVTGTKLLAKIIESQALSRYEPVDMEAPHPGCSQFQYKSDEYWDCLMKYRGNTLYHPMGTCRIGTSIQDSVVDEHFRVFGVSGLRVVDASVFPKAISGNTNIPTIMLGERAAEWILKGQ